MDAKTLEALHASIAKWERNATTEDLGDVVLGLTDCPLCKIFHSFFGGPDCDGCPINAAGFYRCGGSPYEAAEDAYGEWEDGGSSADFHKVAQAEVAFLKSLLPLNEEVAS